MPYAYQLLPICLLFLLACESLEENSRLPYLYVADDFAEVAVESAPAMDSLEATNRFQVFLLNEDKGIAPGQSPMNGKYSIENGRISFVPSSTFNTDQTYRARFYTQREWLERDFYVTNADQVASTHVREIYPTMPFIPQNIRRFHIHFSDSMAPGTAAKSIYMVDLYGDTVRGALPKYMNEGWSPDMKRLTVELAPIYLDSAAQWQADLNARFTLWQQYRVVVDKGMRDAKMRPLTNDHYREYRVNLPTRSRASYSSIKGTPPMATLLPVILTTGKPLDIEMLSSHITLTDKKGNPIPGTVEVSHYEQQWKFTPERPWEAREYQIRIKNSIEDLAGNRRDMLFDEVRKTKWATVGLDYYPLSFWPK